MLQLQLELQERQNASAGERLSWRTPPELRVLALSHIARLTRTRDKPLPVSELLSALYLQTEKKKAKAIIRSAGGPAAWCRSIGLQVIMGKANGSEAVSLTQLAPAWQPAQAGCDISGARVLLQYR